MNTTRMPSTPQSTESPQTVGETRPGKQTLTSRIVQRRASPAGAAVRPDAVGAPGAAASAATDASWNEAFAFSDEAVASRSAAAGGAVQMRASGETGGGAAAGAGQDRQALVSALQTGEAGMGLRVPIQSGWLDWLAGHTGGQAGGAASGDSMPAIEEGDAGSQTRVEGTPFEQGAGDSHEVDINDVRQGALGDCYFLAVLASIARVRPDFIRNMVRDNGDGTYTVTFHTEQGLSGLFGSRSGQSVTVDNQFWTNASGRPIYAGTGDAGTDGPELWVMIIEKAWAQLHGGYGEITGGNVDDDAREAVTGQEAEYISPTDLSAEALLTRIHRHFTTNQEPVIFWSHGDEKQKKLDENGVITNHEYALNGIDREAGTVTLYNPWGRRHLENVDMAFIRANFQRVRFLNLPPAR